MRHNATINEPRTIVLLQRNLTQKHMPQIFVPDAVLEELARFLREFRIALICSVQRVHLMLTAYLYTALNIESDDRSILLYQHIFIFDTS